MTMIKQHGAKDVLRKLQSAFQEKTPSTRAALDPVRRTLTGLFSPSSTSNYGEPPNISGSIMSTLQKQTATDQVIFINIYT